MIDTNDIRQRLSKNTAIDAKEIQALCDEVEWIEVENKLPPDYEYVLVAVPDEQPFIAKLDYFDPRYARIKTWYIKGAPWRGGNWGKSPDESKIKYWKPLPKPPTEPAIQKVLE